MVSLVVPGSSAKMLAKAAGLDVDEIVIDLEDAVIPERKAEALEQVVAALGDDAPRFLAPKVSVRVNGVGTPWCHTELIALATAPGQLDSVIVPKVESGADVAFVDRLLDGAEAAAGTPAPLTVQALIETAAGVSNVADILDSAWRLTGLILGYADLSVSLGRTAAGSDDLDRWLAVQDAILLAARGSQVEAIDGPHLVIDDADGLARAARRACDLGFDGKWAIHPSQIDPIRTAFGPTEPELAHAHEVMRVLEEAAEAGAGAAMLNGQMLDEPVRLMAIRTLRRAGIQIEVDQ